MNTKYHLVYESCILYELGIKDVFSFDNFKDWWSGRARGALEKVELTKKLVDHKLKQIPNSPKLIKANRDLDFSRSELKKLLNVYNATVIGAALLGTAAIVGLFYFIWKRKQSQLQQSDATPEEINSQEQSLKQQFITKLESAKNQAVKFEEEKRQLLIDRLEKAKQRLLKK